MTSLHFPVEIRSLPGGTKVLLMERPQLPVLSLIAMVRAGSICERAEEAGLASFASAVLTSGTSRRNAMDLAEEVDALGASLGVHSDYDYGMVGLSCLSRTADQGVEILGEVLTSPAFLPEEVERRRSDILSVLERRKDDPVELVRNRFIARVYGEHPYGHPREGLAETVSRLRVEDLRDFHRRYYRPQDTLLSVVGDVRGSSILPLLENALAGWGDGAAGSTREAALVLPAMPKPERVRLEKIQKDGMVQATIRAGSLGISRSNPDHVPVMLLNYILGGSGFGSRLMKRLREERGLTYGVHSSFHPRLDPGYFFIECQTGLLTMNEALAAIFAEVDRLLQDGITQTELDWAVRYFSGSLPLSLQTNDQLATRVLEQEFYGLEEEFWLKEIERMRQTTRDEVNAAARRYLHPETFTVVCLADFRQMDLEMPPGVSGQEPPARTSPEQ